MIKNKIAKILVLLDGSRHSTRGLERAIYLARQCGATVTGIHVISIYPQRLGDLVTPLKAKLLEDAKNFMQKSKLTCAQNGIVFHEKIIYGEAKSDIVDFMKHNKFDMVVVGSRGLSGVKETLLGSISNAIVHKSHVPVLVVK